MSRAQKVFEVSSVYRTTGTAYIVATSAAEAARIAVEGYPDGSQPQFYFSDPWGETQMRARPAPGMWPSEAMRQNGETVYPPRPTTSNSRPEGSDA